jgi:pyruvate/2-oxoglutarate dehydrogenase complex dihydrolipoamide dehydrogenase (E3) component
MIAEKGDAVRYDYDLICIGLGPAGMAVSVMASAKPLQRACRFFFRL